MRIDRLDIHNFRRFESLSVHFNSQMNVISGNNGVGKSSVLDALSIGIGSFFLGVEGIPSPGIAKSDARFVTYELGSVLDRQSQFPVNITCTGEVLGSQMSWTRSLNTETGSTTHKEAADIKNCVGRVQSDIRAGNKEIILPIISYYGTGRLWSQKREKQNDTEISIPNRFMGYMDCLSSSSNEKLLKRWFRKMTLQMLQDQIVIPELNAVEKAIAECYIDSGDTVDKVRVRYNMKSEEIVLTYLDENGNWDQHPFHELSDGFRNTMSLVADIAYRMAVLNPQLLDDVTTKTPGVVIIDEIDQHLHPKWQRSILKSLMRIFPKVQFIVTTHSPSVIASTMRNQLILLDENGCHYLDNPYGKDANSVLLEIMGVYPRPEAVQQLLNRFYISLDEEDYAKAKSLLDDLKGLVGEDNSDFVGAQTMLDFETS